jgi:predicted NUDIX family NTP pyrophosphohydrolase
VKKQSAGLIMYRYEKEVLEVFLVHMGGPYWAKKDFGAWSIPKGEYKEEEDSLAAAKREFRQLIRIV